jgi:hypothetical protein
MQQAQTGAAPIAGSGIMMLTPVGDPDDPDLVISPYRCSFRNEGAVAGHDHFMGIDAK